MPLSRLNEEQFKAASTKLGHNLIIASAGTGKTSTIVARIAYLLQNEVAPHEILLLTFTNKASKEMIDRLGKYFDKKITKNILAGTFHGVAYELLKRKNKNISLKMPSELKNLFKSIYARRKFAHISDVKPYEASYLYEIYSLFQNKSENENFADFFLRNYNKEQAVFLQIYEDLLREYEEEKRRFDYVDFNDLLLRLKEELLNEKMEFTEILVDEYQDTNSLQASLIDSFKSKSLFCVGDYDQSIYAFNGADISIIGNFQKRFKDANIYSLNKNYRSSNEILQIANKVILNNERLYPKQLVVTREGNFSKPVLLVYDDLYEQYKEIAKIIYQSSVNHEDIAILFRNKASADGMELALRSHGINCVRKGTWSFFDSKEVKAYCAFLSLFVNPKDIMAFMYLMEHAKGVGSALSKELFDNLSKLGHGNLIKAFLEPDSNVKLEKSVKVNSSLGLFDDLEPRVNTSRFELNSDFKTHPILDFTKINEDMAKVLEQLYLYLKQAKACENSYELSKIISSNRFFIKLCELFINQRCVNKAGQIDSNKKEEAILRMQEKINKLVEYSKEYKDIRNYYNFLSLATSDISSGKGVNLLTIHASKGLEFKTVFIIDLVQERFPNKKLMSRMGGSLEEERRLFYVAATRAMDMLYLSYAKKDSKNKDKEYKPSCFLFEAALC